MTVAITREDIIAELRAMKPSARGRTAIERLARKLTCQQIAFECEIEQALMERMAQDPEWRATMGMV